jgi:hypothetical protein
MMDVAHLAPVSLVELESVAALRTRRDRKYVVPSGELASILTVLSSDARVLEIAGRRTFRYRSVYFDTRQRTLYMLTVHGRRRRAKVRTRTYLDLSRTVLEIKERDGRGRTVKHRYPFVGRDQSKLSADAQSLVWAALAPVQGAPLWPTLITSFARTTFLLADGARATFDRDVRFEAPGGLGVEMPGMVLIETKAATRATRLDRLLWAAHHRPVRFSKYGTGLAALDELLPANRWHRLLGRLEAVSADSHGLAGRSHPPRPIARRGAQTGEDRSGAA